jgi:hypothetical protein
MARILMVALMVAAVAANAGGDQADPNQQLQQRIAELEEKVKALEEIVSGDARPINLGRTSLARVTASAVNGRRTMDNVFYGIVNAFDNGDNWYNNINYTYWLSDYYTGSWADVCFDCPVSVTSIQVEGGPSFTTTLDFSKGGRETYSSVADRLELAAPAHGVTKVRLTFESSEATPRVDEIVISGYVPLGVEYTVQRPRVFMALREAKLAAGAAYEEWWARLGQGIGSPAIQEEQDRFVFTYSRGDVDLLQVVIDKLTGSTTAEELAELTSCPPRPVIPVVPGVR